MHIHFLLDEMGLDAMGLDEMGLDEMALNLVLRVPQRRLDDPRT